MKKFVDYFGKIRRLVKEIFSLVLVVSPGTLTRYLWAILISLPATAKRVSLHPAHERLFGRNYEFKVFGQKVIMDGRYFGYATELFARKVYFALPEFRIHSGDNVLDLGAAEGAFSALAAKLGAKVIAVEADKKVAEEGVGLTVRLNHVENMVQVVCGIVGGGTGMFAEEKSGSEKVRRYDLGELLAQHEMSRVDFMKVDIEGSEYDLFSGNPKWLPGVRKIAMEVHFTFGQSFGDAKVLKKNLEAGGFKVLFVDIDGRIAESLSGPAGYLFAWREGSNI